MLGVVRKEKHLRYLANLVVNGHSPELGADATKVISVSGDHSKIARTNMSVAPHTKEVSISHRQILLEDGPEGYDRYVREREGLLLTDTTWCGDHQHGQLLQTSPKVRLLPRYVGW